MRRAAFTPSLPLSGLPRPHSSPSPPVSPCPSPATLSSPRAPASPVLTTSPLSSAPPASPDAPDPIEVEVKFTLSASTRARLLSHAAELRAPVSSAVFIDEYFDDARCSLTTADTWLRRRAGVWQLKRLAGGRGAAGAATSAHAYVYAEIEGGERVRKALQRDAPLVDGPGGGVVDGLERFAWLETERNSFVVPVVCGLRGGEQEQAEIVVVMDECRGVGDGADRFEHCVGEVEIVVKEPESVGWAQQEIDRFCNEVGVGGSDDLRKDSGSGKVEQFLKQFRPDMHLRLVEAGVLRAIKAPQAR